MEVGRRRTEVGEKFNFLNMKNAYALQGILSIAALICLTVGWFDLFSPEINDFLYRKLFYILIGISFFLLAPFLTNKKFIFPMYIAALLCVIGAFIPQENRYSAIKTIGLFAGIIISLFNRPRIPRN